jgi:hypothetical protein
MNGTGISLDKASGEEEFNGNVEGSLLTRGRKEERKEEGKNVPS